MSPSTADGGRAGRGLEDPGGAGGEPRGQGLRGGEDRHLQPRQRGFFFDEARWATCEALCARIVPRGTDPVTEPGAQEVGAVVFIDRFLAAFELPREVSDNPAIWLRGPFTRDMLTPEGRASFLALSRSQKLAWMARLYGPEALAAEVDTDKRLRKWASQVAEGMIPGCRAGGLRRLYAQGLDAFDAFSTLSFGHGFAEATAEEQDVLIEAAGGRDPCRKKHSSTEVYAPVPAAAAALFPQIRFDTFAACYSLPAYRWQARNPLWDLAGTDGDTQPDGNSRYEDGEHVELRPISTFDPGPRTLDEQSAREMWRLLSTFGLGG